MLFGYQAADDVTTPNQGMSEERMPLKIESSAFAPGAEIPIRYTGEGEDLSPPLAWSGLPQGTKSLALIVDDPDAPVRFWWNRFGPMFAAEIRKKRVAHMRFYPQWRWHLDEAFVKVNGKLCYLWRAVDHEGEVLESVVTAKRDKAAALKLLKRIMKKYGRPRKLVTDGLCSYPAAMEEVGIADRQEVGRRLNNRAENSHQPFRRRERAMQRFRSMKSLQKFSSVHAQVHNHFNQERHLVTRQVYKQRRSATLAEWRALAT